MAKHDLAMEPGEYSATAGVYKVRSGTPSIDPLALMLEGTQCTGYVYRDYSYEFAIPPGAMDVFKMYVTGRDGSSNWSRQNADKACQLKNFGHAIFYINRSSFGDAAYLFDRVPDLSFNRSIKKLTIGAFRKKVERKNIRIPQTYSNGFRPLW